MNTLIHFADKFGFDPDQTPPIILKKMERQSVADTFAELGFRTGAEIGVATGVHSELLCKTIPDLKLYCVDPWANVDGYNSFNYRKLYRWRMEAEQKLKPYNAVILQKMSMEAVKEFQDGSLDFVYLDGAHDFRHIAEDMYEWGKKVRAGGVLYGHDYIHKLSGRYACHVPQIVEAYVKAFLINRYVVFGEGGHIHGKPIPREWMIFL